MTPSRFNALSFLHTYKDFLDGLDVISVANDFVSLNIVRYNNFGTFTKSDLQLYFRYFLKALIYKGIAPFLLPQRQHRSGLGRFDAME